ncbi:hypothetical protein ACFQ0D_36460 [Micromonospora zhanjiangensis]
MFSTPSSTGIENRPLSSSVNRPIMRARPEIRPRARMFGWKASSAAARWTRRRVASATSCLAFSAFDLGHVAERDDLRSFPAHPKAFPYAFRPG